jgi:D-alanine-D-alanine ligase
MTAKVLILYTEPTLPVDHPDAAAERDVLNTVAAVSQHLDQAGFRVSELGINNDPQSLLNGLRRRQPDVVFNLFEGTAERGEIEAFVDGLLEWLRVPFTGCSFQAACLALNKPLTKHLLRGAGLPTPDFMVVERLPVGECSIEWPAIVKPALKDASVGIDQGSVVTDRRQLEERVALLLKRYGPPVMIEQFIPGRELNVGVIDFPKLRALPVSEILFLNRDPGHWPIVTYDAKWAVSSGECEETPPKCPADLPPELAEHLASLACRAFQLVGCRDYGRVDFRLDHAGRPFVLEVNPNPDFEPSAGFARGLLAAGISHAQFCVSLIERAVERRIRREPRAVPGVENP